MSVVHVGADPNGIKIVTNTLRVRNHSRRDHIINPRITIQAKSTDSTRQNNSSNSIRSGTTFMRYINVYRLLILDQRTANTPMYRKTSVHEHLIGCSAGHLVFLPSSFEVRWDIRELRDNLLLG
ncbi:hypothetical protein BASA61_007258 [Batrachochytrium salamandrivorans]|nr:hypothetical protein BASA61_007258 [Batrachochytrium salamandrivorans]